MIGVFDAKYHYNFWRPATAIRNGDIDGNEATQREPSWISLIDAPITRSTQVRTASRLRRRHRVEGRDQQESHAVAGDHQPDREGGDAPLDESGRLHA